MILVKGLDIFSQKNQQYFQYFLKYNNIFNIQRIQSTSWKIKKWKPKLLKSDRDGECTLKKLKIIIKVGASSNNFVAVYSPQ